MDKKWQNYAFFKLTSQTKHGIMCKKSAICWKKRWIRTKIPALSQLIEQSARILFVVLLFLFVKKTGEIPSVKLAAAGIAAGETAAALFSIQMLNRQKQLCYAASISSISKTFRKLSALSVPLTANRTAVTLLQSIEAASIPTFLKIYGMTSSEALRLYGVLTGMAPVSYTHLTLPTTSRV